MEDKFIWTWLICQFYLKILQLDNSLMEKSKFGLIKSQVSYVFCCCSKCLIKFYFVVVVVVVENK